MIIGKDKNGNMQVTFHDIEWDELKEVLKKPYCRQELSAYQKGLVKDLLDWY